MPKPRTSKLTAVDLHNILHDITCSVGAVDWSPVWGPMGGGFYIQLRYEEPDINTGEVSTQYCRKWYISKHSTKSEIVQTVLKACLTSVEHMVREHFRYQGVPVLTPHYDIDLLVQLHHEHEGDVTSTRTPATRKVKTT